MNKKPSLSTMLLCFCIVACQKSGGPAPDTGQSPSGAQGKESEYSENDAAALFELAERERRGQYEAGVGLVESSLRERSGDYAGAVAAAYKDLAYAYSRGQIERSVIDARLDALESRYAESPRPEYAAVAQTVQALRDFNKEKWKAASDSLAALASGDSQPDSFLKWMRLAALASTRTLDRTEREEYSLMQARYGLLPDYWYYSALIMDDPGLKRDAAERCVALAPSGPLAAGSRGIIAGTYGLDRDAAKSLLIRPEIEAVVAGAIQNRRPEALSALMPLLGLPDNPATLYAVGALKGVANVAEIRAWLEAEAARSSGRTAERLRYIVGR